MTVRYLTTAEVAAKRGVSPHTITRWARMGRLPYSIKVGRFWFHHPDHCPLELPL